MSEKFNNVKEIITGHIFIILSSIFYSVAWIAIYKPITFISDNFSNSLITAALFLGIIGTVLIIFGISKTSILKDKKIKIVHLLFSCLFLCILTYVITFYLFNRIFTSEIILIFLWLALESCSIYVLFYGNKISKSQMILSLFFMLLSILIGIICYTIHYELPDFERFINGLIPYFVISFTMFIIIIFVSFRKHKL